MVLDTSAIVAMVLKKPGHERITALIEQAEEVLVGAPSVLEAGMVLTSRLKRDSRFIVQDLLRHARAQVIPFSEEQAWTATMAFLRFGRGRHTAALNFGDCMSYAVASCEGHPLLYIGNDFSETDISAA